MDITSKEVIHRLQQSGRYRFTERQLTDFRCKQLLPPLQRRRQPGSRKPLYLWNEDVVPQAAYLHDLLQWDRQHDRLYLPLWLAGHDIPLRAVRRLLLRFIERHLSRLTQGKTDLDDVLDHVSMLIYERMLPKWKYSPKKREPILSLGVETWAEIVELTFGFLASPLYEPDLELLAGLVLRMARLQEETPAEIATDPESLFRAAVGFQQIFRQLSPLLSIPKLKEAVELATPEEWLRARYYYQVLRNTADFIIVEINACLAEPFPDAFFYRVTMNGALYLLPLFLSLIYREQAEPLEQGERYLGVLVEFLKQHGWSEKHPREVLLEIVHQYEAEREGLEERKAG